MIKGIERRVVEMKLPSNRFYERACLVLKVDLKNREADERDLIEEARRILSTLGVTKKGERRRTVLRILFALLCFLLGILTGVCVGSIIK